MFLLPPLEELKARQAKFAEGLAKKKLPGALITDDANMRYLSGFAGHDSALLFTPKHKLLLTDFRYLEEGQKTSPGWKVAIRPIKTNLLAWAAQQAKKHKLAALGVERTAFTLAQRDALRKEHSKLKLLPQGGLLEDQRLAKSAWEVSQIEAALRIQERAFVQVCKMLKPGIREFEAAAELRYLMLKAGADDQAFDCMFQWGSSSSLPHGRVTDKPMPAECIVLIDWGARYNGYHGDLTRTFFIGNIPRRLREIHEIVGTAQARSLERIKPGVTFKEADSAARNVIRKAGYGKLFGHGTGHGLGLRIHEAPRLNQSTPGKLQPGMVVTVEPGIYVAGVGGVRIEDDVLVTKDGARILSRMPKGLRWDGSNK